MNIRKTLLAFGSIVFAFGNMNATASGFAILEQSASGLGRALSGMAADTHETGALYFNPATGVWHDKMQISLGGSWLHVDALLDSNGQNTANGVETGNGGGWEHIPHFYMVKPLTEDLAFGLGFSATSGTAVSWNRRWYGRYNNISTEIASIDITPSLSYKLTDNLSIGLGLCIEYCDATMKQATPTIVNGVYMAGHDGKLTLQGDSLGFGFTTGIFYQPIEGTRLGIGYRSTMKQELEMDGTLAVAGRKFGGHADCDLDLPGMADFAIQQDLNEKWTVMADACWTHGHTMEEMTVNFHKGHPLYEALGTDSATVDMHWRNSMKYAVGAEYRLNDKWTLRVGTAYDQTPVRSKRYRTASLPDCSRLWFCTGVSYQVTENCRLDIGYVKLLFEQAPMRLTTPLGETVSCNVDGGCDILSYALTYTF